MNENNSWSAGVGRWMGVQVNIHVMFFLVVAFIFSIQWQYAHVISQDQVGTALITSMVLLVSVLAHELGHIFALTNLGGSLIRVVITPWGGNSEMELPENAWAQLIVTASGPFVNFGIFLFSTVLLVQSNLGNLQDIISPLNPHTFSAAAGAVSLFKIAAWINFYLFAINLIPCFPLDGAQVVRSVLKLLRLSASPFRSECAIMVLGNGVAIGAFALSWLLLDFNHGPVRPAWFYVMAFAISLYFAARYSFDIQTKKIMGAIDNQDWEFDQLGSDAGFYDTSDLRSPLDDLNTQDTISQSQWMTEKQESRQREILERERQEDCRADEILEKIHMGGEGIEGLNPEERAILNRVSNRIRRRRSSEQEIYGER